MVDFKPIFHSMYERLIHIRRQIFCFYIPIPSIYKRVMINEEAMY